MANEKPKSQWRSIAWWLPVGLLFGFLGSRLGKSIKAGDLGPMGFSELVAMAVGIVLVAWALIGILVVFNVHAGGRFMDREQAADLRERSRMFFYSYIWMAASGLLLILLSLAAPGGLLFTGVVLPIALVIVAILAVLGIATWRLSDELMRTLSQEAGNMAFYLIWAIGGAWSVLAHLRFVQAPAPLDWVTMFTALPFVASFIAVGRRKLFQR